MQIVLKYNNSFISKLTIISLIAGFISQVLAAQTSKVTLQIDGAERYQTVDGFGVNINTAWWYDGEYRNTDVVKPAIDMLVDSLDATIFRAVIEDMDLSLIHI